jgi:hypothetical protein
MKANEAIKQTVEKISIPPSPDESMITPATKGLQAGAARQ